MENLLLTTLEAAQYLSVSTSTIYRYISKGRIPHIRKGFGLRFRKSDLDEWLAKDKRVDMTLPLAQPEVLTWTATRDIDMSKGGKSKLTKKGQTCFNYGFGHVRLRTYKSGRTCWTIDYHDENSNRIQKTLPHVQSREEAAFALQKRVAEVFDRRNGIECKRRNIGFRVFAKIYLEDYMKTVRRNFRPDIYRLHKLCDYFKDIDLRDVTPLMIERFRKSKLEDGRTKSTCNRYLQLMKRMFNVAIEEGYAEENPVRKVRLYSEKDNLQERVFDRSRRRKAYGDLLRRSETNSDDCS